MAFDPTNHNHGSDVPEAERPEGDSAPAEAPDAPPVGDAGPGSSTEDDAVRDRAEAVPDRADAAVATEPAEAAEPAEAYAIAGEELEELVAKAARSDEYLSLAQRTQADFENYRKRSIRETAAAQERGAVKLAMALLPAVDNLERALAHVQSDPAHPDVAGFVTGIEHVHSDVVSALEKAGIEWFSPEGEPFDPTLHEAVAQQPVEGAEPGTVVEVFQRGYRIGETVVRPARVVVAG